MKIKFTTLSIVLMLASFSVTETQAQQLQLVRVIDTVLSVKTTNTTGNHKYIDILTNTPTSKTIEVPKGKVWVVNAGHGNRSNPSPYVFNTSTSSAIEAGGRLRVDDGGDVFSFTSTIGGRLTLAAGTKLSLDLYSSSPFTYKLLKHNSNYASTFTWFQYFFSITEYEIVP